MAAPPNPTRHASCLSHWIENMHTFQTKEAPYWIVNHNGDFSGDVILTFFKRSDEDRMKEITVPFELLKQLVAEYVRTQRINALENADAADLLGVSD